MTASEFDIIKRYFWHQPASKQTVLGVGDDGAVLSIPEGHQLVTSIDTLNENVHFCANADPYTVGYKALAVSLSDMAAMGAKPIAAQLGLCLEEVDEVWLQGFASGFMHLANQYQVDLIGGDTTQGPLSINSVLYGIVPNGRYTRRQGAQLGDDIYISGTLGAPGLALINLQQQRDMPDDLKQTLDCPRPRIDLGIGLRGLVTSMIDVSDGLHADLSHILKASHCGANIQLQALPIASWVEQACDLSQQQQLALFAGDEYELCFTAPAGNRERIDALAKQLRLPVARIGSIEAAEGIRYIQDGQEITIKGRAYEHFRT